MGEYPSLMPNVIGWDKSGKFLVVKDKRAFRKAKGAKIVVGYSRVSTDKQAWKNGPGVQMDRMTSAGKCKFGTMQSDDNDEDYDWTFLAIFKEAQGMQGARRGATRRRRWPRELSANQIFVFFLKESCISDGLSQVTHPSERREWEPCPGFGTHRVGKGRAARKGARSGGPQRLQEAREAPRVPPGPQDVRKRRGRSMADWNHSSRFAQAPLVCGFSWRACGRTVAWGFAGGSVRPSEIAMKRS